MRFSILLFVLFGFSGGAAFAQYGQRAPVPAQEECPQGRQIRAQKSYPSTMSDCAVLDADTAAENQRLRHNPAVGPRPPARIPQTVSVDPPDEFYRPRPGEAYDHWTYCNWNRTGLPDAYQKICSRFDREKASSAERVLATASPALREYEANMTRASNNVYVAGAVATVCHLRSQTWWTTILDGWQPFTVSEAERLQLSSAESAAVLNKIELAKKPALVFEGPGNFCEKIVNSSVISELDEIERKLTGNYH